MPKQEVLVIHNTTRKVGTRALRKQASGRLGLTQKLGGGDLMVRRGRPKAVSLDVIRKNLPELLAACRSGAIEIREPSGQLVNPEDLEPMGGSGYSLPNTSPNFRLDSAQNDKNPVRPPRRSGNALVPTPEAMGKLPSLLVPTKEEEALTLEQEYEREEWEEAHGMEPQVTADNVTFSVGEASMAEALASQREDQRETFTVAASEVGDVSTVLGGLPTLPSLAEEPIPPVEEAPAPEPQVEPVVEAPVEAPPPEEEELEDEVETSAPETSDPSGLPATKPPPGRKKKHRG